MADDKGFLERLFDRLDDTADVDEKTGKVGGGFRPEVCVGCPERGDGPLKPCGLCSCPTVSNGTLDKFGRTPEGCPREREHKR